MLWRVEEDWRLVGQERFLQGATFRHEPYQAWREDWEHGHCAFCTQRVLPCSAGGFDDIYLNQDNQVQAGRSPWDTVLGDSAAHPCAGRRRVRPAVRPRWSPATRAHHPERPVVTA